MANKALILYASMTGNTEKVALRFKQTFEKKGWQCDMVKVDKNIAANPPFNYKDYNFLCVGSYV
jgi:flavodoxin